MNYNEGKKMGKIYKITCNITGECYFGSTIKAPCERLGLHKGKYNHTSSKQIIERDDYNYEVLERFYVDGPNNITLPITSVLINKHHYQHSTIGIFVIKKE